MVDGTLDRIENALSIHLPAAYRKSVVPFPIPHEAGNADSHVWDDADRLIALNQLVRRQVEQWPQWLFVIGQVEGDPCGYAIDTRTPDCPVWWLEQMQLGRNSGPAAGSFEQWFAQWVRDIEPGTVLE
jgi:hypothetical protein